MTEASSPRPGLLGWWPVVAILLVAVVGLRMVGSRYDATGHAAGHLGTALTTFLMAALLAIVLWATPKGHCSWAIRLASLAYLFGLAAIVVGNLRVVDAIGARNWSDDEASALGEGVVGFESGHSLSAQGELVSVLASLALIWALRARRAIPTGLAIGATVASIVFPYWILPGAGVVVLAVGTVVLRARSIHRKAEPVPATSVEVG